MVKKELLENLSRLGFPLVETEGKFNANTTLAEVVKSDDARLWEGFPVLLANIAEDYTFDYEQVKAHLDNKENQESFQHLLLLSMALYSYFHLSFVWSGELNKKMSGKYAHLLKKWKNALADDGVVEFQNKSFQASRVKRVFLNYFEQNAERTQSLRKKNEELSLEFSLSQVFSPKQKELFKKKLNGEMLSKTEREYYSRTVKKKVAALANQDVHRMAQKLLE